MKQRRAASAHPRLVAVRAPSRLHFGLLCPKPERPADSWGGPPAACRMFGGAGVMIDRPGMHLTFERAARLVAAGPLAERAVRMARRWAEFHRLPPPGVSIVVLAAPPEHVGLGVGTQLGMSIAAGLAALFELPRGTPEELALAAGRGERSSVGAHGFVHGGLIVDAGKSEGDLLGPLACRVEVPSNWRFLLVTPAGAGTSGREEREAFDELPFTPPAVAGRLAEELRLSLLPAAAAARFDDFSESLYRYGRSAGELFAAAQGGPYNGAAAIRIVATIRGLGVAGVGQTSWGPTVFAAIQSEEQGRRLASEIERSLEDLDIVVTLARPCNEGVRINIEG